MDIEQILLDNDCEGTAYFTGDDYDTAILGITDEGNLVYSYELMIEWYINKYECSDLEAIEWIDYNVIRSVPYMGDKKPIIIHELIY